MDLAEWVDPILVVYVVLGGALVLFITGAVRYDLVALLALLVLVGVGLVPHEEAFTGFANPAVVTVVAVLVISRALAASGIASVMGSLVGRFNGRPSLQIAALCGIVAIISAFINNVGALALMMPVALELSRKQNRSPSTMLMPMAFASLLGGMTTLIGTPPNLIVSAFRERYLGEEYGFFDFTPVGIAVAGAGLVFLALIGWRLVPVRHGSGNDDLFEINSYLTEVAVEEGNPHIGSALGELFGQEDEVSLVGGRRGEARISVSNRYLPLRAGDILLLQGNPNALNEFAKKWQLQLTGAQPKSSDLADNELEIIEAVVTANSTAEGSTARRLDLRRLFGINMLALSRRGRAIRERLKDVRFVAGDVLLLQVPRDSISRNLTRLGLLPLARRDIQLARIPRLTTAIAIFAVAITATVALDVSSSIAFAAAATGMVLLRVISIREAHEAIDWPIIILLGAMIPVGTAFETTGAADQLTSFVAGVGEGSHPMVMLGVILVFTMILTEVLNNAATVVIMSPVAYSLAQSLGLNADPFLMAVAVGASCDFLSPIGHQSNTLVLGPGGYHFGDYARMGIWLTLLTVAVTLPMLSVVFPLETVPPAAAATDGDGADGQPAPEETLPDETPSPVDDLENVVNE